MKRHRIRVFDQLLKKLVQVVAAEALILSDTSIGALFLAISA